MTAIAAPGSEVVSTISGMTSEPADTKSWTFLTNHAHVLIAIQRDPELRQREIAEMVGITLGAAQRIISELEHGGYLRTHKVGRRNRYEIIGRKPLRHPLEAHHSVTNLLDALD